MQEFLQCLPILVDLLDFNVVMTLPLVCKQACTISAPIVSEVDKGEERGGEKPQPQPPGMGVHGEARRRSLPSSDELKPQDDQAGSARARTRGCHRSRDLRRSKQLQVAPSLRL